ncbi:hypothetical protein V6N13_118786 [Hibiscus sabdariffa]
MEGEGLGESWPRESPTGIRSSRSLLAIAISDLSSPIAGKSPATSLLLGNTKITPNSVRAFLSTHSLSVEKKKPQS